MDNSKVFVKSDVHPIEVLFIEKYDVDFYQREYVWEKKQIEDMEKKKEQEILSI